MRRIGRLWASAFLLCLAAPFRPAEACTRFCLQSGGQTLFGKNYDFAIGDGILVVNKRGVSSCRWTRSRVAADFLRAFQEADAAVVRRCAWAAPGDAPASACT